MSPQARPYYSAFDLATEVTALRRLLIRSGRPRRTGLAFAPRPRPAGSQLLHLALAEAARRGSLVWSAISDGRDMENWVCSTAHYAASKFTDRQTVLPGM